MIYNQDIRGTRQQHIAIYGHTKSHLSSAETTGESQWNLGNQNKALSKWLKYVQKKVKSY